MCEGLDDPYEVPTDANLVVDVSTQTVPEIVHSMSNKSSITFNPTDFGF